MKTLSIVIPVYFNEGSLPHLFTELMKVNDELRRREMELELIFVDDGSEDGSLQELLRIKESYSRTKIIKLTRNFGAIPAIKTGFRYVSGDCFMILAADLQDPPTLILEMADRWLSGAKYVVCARSGRGDSLSTRMFANSYYRLIRAFVIKGYPHEGFDMSLMDRELLDHLNKSGKNLNIVLFAYWLGYEPTVIHYKREHRRHGKSRWTFAKKVTLFLDSMLGFSIVPVRAISLIGVAVSLVSFLYGSFILVSSILGFQAVQGFPTLAALISFLAGLIIVMLGVIGEYLWRIFDQLSDRPEAVIDEVY